MHPILGNRSRLGVYLAAWGVLGLLFAVLERSGVPRQFTTAALYAVPLALAYGFVCLSSWWVCRAAPLARTPPLRLGVSLVVPAMVASVFWAMLGAAWTRILGAVTLDAPTATLRATAGDHPVPTAVFLALGVPLYLFSVAIHYLIAAFEDSRRAERRALESQVVAREAELRALRAQLNPHFLFNSLNSINALVGSDPESARRMCEGLGDFLRKTLTLGGRDWVTLGEELDLVETYLAIERVRFGSRLRVELLATPAARSHLVPPLLLQPLVENAVKHGIAERVEGGTIAINAQRHADTLIIKVTNPFDPEGPQRQGEGMGLENVRQRLRALNPRHTSIVASQTAGCFEVVLSLTTAGTGPGETP